MDLIICLSSLFLLLSITLSTLFLYYHYHSKQKEPPMPSLPPGSMGWPLLGETLNFLAAGREGKPEAFVYDRLFKYAPHHVFKTSLFCNKMMVMCGTASNKLLFSNENKLVTKWWPPSIDKVFPSTHQLPSDEESKKIRKSLLDFLVRPEILRCYVPIMDDCTRRHIASGAWGPTERLEAYNVTKDYTFMVACRLFLSIDAQKDPVTVASLFRPFSELLTGLLSIPISLPGTSFYSALRASKEVRRKLRDIIRKRRVDLVEGKASPTQDILSHLIHTPIGASTNDDSKFEYYNDDELAGRILGLIVGGHDTTRTVITFVFKYLAELPHIYDAVYQEQMEIAKSKKPGDLLTWEDVQKMKYSWNVACEVMRLAPPVQGDFRQAITDFVHEGFQIPKGWKIYWSTHSTHRDPECFPEPEKFDPTRFEGNGPQPYSFVPFGGGPRMCPGKEYARIKILVFMHNIITRFKWEKLLPNEKIIVGPMPFPANGLPLRMIPHLTP